MERSHFRFLSAEPGGYKTFGIRHRYHSFAEESEAQPFQALEGRNRYQPSYWNSPAVSELGDLESAKPGSGAELDLCGHSGQIKEGYGSCPYPSLKMVKKTQRN
jgi:hypothetical protein